MALQEIINAVLALDEDRTARLVAGELERGIGPATLLDRGLIAAMNEVGERYARHELFVPEMLMAARAFKSGMEVLRPCLRRAAVPARGSIVIGTVRGDRHDIGKNLVAMSLECAGFDVIDLGVDVDAVSFVEAARAKHARVVGLSALLTSVLPEMERTVSAIRRDGGAAKTVVGGAPVTRSFARGIGADGYSPDAPGTVAVVRRLLGIEGVDGRPAGTARGRPLPGRGEEI